ncbi:DNA replication regulator Sld3 [Penicillium hispanicum]|uniref:DNA replication regulator Sld3 n=1 Tax=Penicillium hispanicum TaxID=1080232 RepID=UPI002541B66B|nr:DNA replication regulator Sld3 [Penicillium hispanicum]KAJ5587641.1 DNA replication regulator Sld3 [Penicillium hispanicum]
MTARTIPSALDPLSSSTLSKVHEVAQPPSKKRRIGTDNAAGQLATSSIVIKAHAASLSDEPLVLDPLTALPRSRLPLSWLEDASLSRSDTQPGGLFVADIPALETDLCGYAEPTVLAVRLVSDGGLYLVERVKRGIYSLSRLARCVHEGDVVVAAKGWHTSRAADRNVEPEDKACAPLDAASWWQSAQIEEPTSDIGLGEEFGGLQVEVVFGQSEPEASPDEPPFVDVVERRSQSLVPVSKGDHHDVEALFRLPESQLLGGDAMDVDGTADSNETGMKQSPEELLSGMRDHYLQALYISKTSVAYFAKGPLTRCRTSFQTTGSEQPHSPADLIEYYREAILAAKKMDLKYRETLPTAIRDAVLDVSDSEGQSKSKKRKSRKKNLGKNGLYAEENDFIRKWWKDRSMMESSAQETSRETETKKHISDLRLRETQLQILLILEVMSLELTTANDKTKSETEKVTGEENTTKKTRAKKPQDLNVLLELHLDRLCIWHAVSSEESAAADSAKTSSFSDSHMSGKKVESDAVRDFCTEVIIPFYASRLPDKCKLITRKFGVSGGISPAGKKSSGKTQRAEPGSEVKRQPPPQKSRRSLQRVLTDEKTAAASQNRHPSLTRSNTAPSKHEAKRGSMEPLLPTLLSSSVRGGIQQAKRVENREVDLHAVARQHETKLRKVQMLVDQKKELDAAIHTLRKPNRELVARDIADDAVKRVSTGGGSSRKPKNPTRNPNGQGVQVMATPRGNRKKDAVVGLPPLPRSLAPSRSFAGEMEDHSLAESPVMIPSSGRRAISFSGPDSDPFTSRRPVSRVNSTRQAPSAELGSIQETPTRPPPKLFLEDNKSAGSTGQMFSSAHRGKGLFRVPDLPAPRSTNSSTTGPFSQPTAPSTPVSSRRKAIPTSTPTSSNPLKRSFDVTQSPIMETPPRQCGLDFARAPRSVPIVPVMAPSQARAQSPPAVMGTPVKEPAAVPVTPDKSQTKSIYEQLGWDDDEMDL